MPPYKPPRSGTLPAKGKRILKKVYVGCRKKNRGEEPAKKSKCARIAWSKVRKAGFRKKSYAKKKV